MIEDAEGFEAWGNGMAYESCPYMPGPRRTAWRDGWMEAENLMRESHTEFARVALMATQESQASPTAEIAAQRAAMELQSALTDMDAVWRVADALTYPTVEE